MPAHAATAEDLCERRRAERELPNLNPQERRALGLLATGHSYEEICALAGWTYTKVNRCVTEGGGLRELEAERAHERSADPSLTAAG